MHALKITSVSKRFDDVIAVNDCSLTVNRGEMFALVGPDGSGKTTTIRMLCGIVAPSGGELSVLGFDVLTQKDEVKKRIGYLSQKFSLYGDLTIDEATNQVRFMVSNQTKALVNQMSEEELDRLHDKALVVPIVEELEEAAAEAGTKPSPAAEAELQAQVVEKIRVIERTIVDKKVRVQVQQLRQDLQKKRIGGNSAILRLLQIIRFILAFIPG